MQAAASGFKFLPEQASTAATQYDYLWWWLVFVSVVMTLVIFIGVFAFAIKYRARSPHEVPRQIHGSTRLEVAWSVAPFLIMLTFFFWGTWLYFDNQHAPANAMNIYVVAKQWMWKIQYPNGTREINEMHVPVGRAIRLTMASEDVIHSFFVPAFRLKRDVVPGHYNDMWFTATRPGRYHLFCAEYCGTEHSGMIGWVTVMEPRDFENWLSGGGGEGSMASQGEKLFQQLGCSTCHLLDEQGRCPNLRGVYGSRVLLNDGRTVVADDAYVRESIINPNAKIVAGFQPDIMPTFQGQVSEEGILQLIEFVKSLSGHKTGMITSKQTGQTEGSAREGSVNNEGQGTLQPEGANFTTQPPRDLANRQAQRKGNYRRNP